MQIIHLNSALRANSPAKLNIQLAILGRRPDQFHEIETVMLKVSLFDSLRVANRPDGQLNLSVRRANASVPANIPTGPENLVIKAASELQRRLGVRFGANIFLEKRIPAEAGLAGGSSNAAAALLLLNELWRLRLSRDELMPIASRLGSDVPFFLDSAAAAVARGRGEYITPLPMRGPLHFVIAKPPFGLSTARVYQTYHEHSPETHPSAAPIVQALASGRPAILGRFLGNDLMPAAEAIQPELKTTRDLLQAICPLGTLMTGSGSALFGLCATRRHAHRAARQLQGMTRMPAFAVTTL